MHVPLKSSMLQLVYSSAVPLMPAAEIADALEVADDDDTYHLISAAAALSAATAFWSLTRPFLY